MAEPYAGDATLVDDPSFHLTIRFSKPVIVGVRGELDMLTAPGLGALLGALVDAGELSIVLDVAALEFMDVVGLRVFAATSARLRPVGGTIVLRSPSSTVRRILEITDMLGLIEVDAPAQLAALSPAFGRTETTAVVTAAPPAAVALSSLRGLSLSPASRDVADAALRLVTSIASEMLSGADGASVTLRRDGKLSTIGATNDKAAAMDGDQYATGQGPCLSATADGHQFHVQSVAEENRWPRFIPRAIESGIGSILSTPLIVAARPVGALNIYSNTEQAFGPDQQIMAALLARHASGVLAVGGEEQTAGDVAGRLLHALRGRESIARAEGVIMTQQGISAIDASADIRRSARRQSVTVRILAASILAAATADDPTGEVGQ